MRKLMLVSALLLSSASAQAGELLLASDAAPHAYSTNHAEPLPPLAKNDKNDSVKPQVDARRYREARMRRISARYGF